MSTETPSLNLSWLTPHLAVGGRYPMDAAAYLARALDIRHVVDLRVECCDDEAVLRDAGITFLHLPTQDMRGVSQAMLDDGVGWVSERLDREEKVYVHCEHGIGRSALLCLCVLVHRGHQPIDALSVAKDARIQVSPSPEQLDAFTQWCTRMAQRSGREVRIPTFNELAMIAYRHLRQDAANGA